MNLGDFSVFQIDYMGIVGTTSLVNIDVWKLNFVRNYILVDPSRRCLLGIYFLITDVFFCC